MANQFAAVEVGSAYREKHIQRITEEMLELPPAVFDGCQFVAFLGRGIHMLPSGGVEIRLNVHPANSDSALPLRQAFSLPLSVDIQLWEPASE